MQTTAEQLQQWLAEPEGVRLEFKEAKQNYHFDKLVEYCVALANEGGGKIILGVTDRRPRRIVGTAAFAEPGRTEAGLHDRLSHRIPREEQGAAAEAHPGQRSELRTDERVPPSPAGAVPKRDPGPAAGTARERGHTQGRRHERRALVPRRLSRVIATVKRDPRVSTNQWAALTTMMLIDRDFSESDLQPAAHRLQSPEQFRLD